MKQLSGRQRTGPIAIGQSSHHSAHKASIKGFLESHKRNFRGSKTSPSTGPNTAETLATSTSCYWRRFRELRGWENNFEGFRETFGSLQLIWWNLTAISSMGPSQNLTIEVSLDTLFFDIIRIPPWNFEETQKCFLRTAQKGFIPSFNLIDNVTSSKFN